ncbi:MAG: hypothetical protein K2Y21_14475 [Phycisphaerales bacterium]|nr:hypothetical protein [Phycisphaerales bacterium]
MNMSNHNITPGSDDAMARLLDQVGRADAGTAARGTDPLGITLEDRVFNSTRMIVSAQSPVIARIGPRTRFASGLRIAAAVAIVGLLGLGYGIASRSSTPTITTTTLAAANASDDVEVVLAAVSLLDEPLAAGIDDLAADAIKLHELVTSDRTLGVDTGDEPSQSSSGSNGASATSRSGIGAASITLGV